MGIFDFFSPIYSLKLVARNATYYYAQIRTLYPKLPEEQARFMALYVNAWSARNEISEDTLRSLVSTWADHDWSMLCWRYAVLYAKTVGRDSRLDDSITGIIKYGKQIGSEIQSAVKDVENGSGKYRNYLLSMPPDVFFKLVEMSLPPSRRSEAARIVLKTTGVE